VETFLTEAACWFDVEEISFDDTVRSCIERVSTSVV
jgi:hypothetical protein